MVLLLWLHSCVALGQLHNLSEPHFLHTQKFLKVVELPLNLNITYKCKPFLLYKSLVSRDNLLTILGLQSKILELRTIALPYFPPSLA